MESVYGDEETWHFICRPFRNGNPEHPKGSSFSRFFFYFCPRIEHRCEPHNEVDLFYEDKVKSRSSDSSPSSASDECPDLIWRGIVPFYNSLSLSAASQLQTFASIAGTRRMLGCCPANKTPIASGKGNLTEESCSLAHTGRRAVCETNAAD